MKSDEPTTSHSRGQENELTNPVPPQDAQDPMNWPIWLKASIEAGSTGTERLLILFRL
jgi:hypothetical protein